MKTWVITDTHFEHEPIRRYCNRPDDADMLVIYNWRQRVKPHDLVIHLGDVHFGAPADLKPIMDRLPGTKILVKGNHDRRTKKQYIECGFTMVVDSLCMSGAYFTHQPATSFPEEANINICGHVHNNPYEKIAKHGHRRFTPNHYVLALELMDYAPQTLESILKGRWHRKDLVRP